MSYSPKISILIPIYNVERYLGKCLDSVFKQSYQNIEYVFVDDCSSDSCGCVNAKDQGVWS